MGIYLKFKGKSIKNLSFGLSKTAGRNNTGRITSYHRGSGHKNSFRLIDFRKSVWNTFGFVKRIEYDPNRNCFLSLLIYSNGVCCYSISMEDQKVGDIVISSDSANISTGNSTYIKNIPIGRRISCVERIPLRGAQFIRSAGAFASIIYNENTALLKLKSTKMVRIGVMCIATIGTVSNVQFIYRNFRKAGYYRLKGWRPVVRGVAMNPVDHPHGGGQGKTSGGRPSVTPWGKITKGKPTRRV